MIFLHPDSTLPKGALKEDFHREALKDTLHRVDRDSQEDRVALVRVAVMVPDSRGCKVQEPADRDTELIRGLALSRG